MARRTLVPLRGTAVPDGTIIPDGAPDPRDRPPMRRIVECKQYLIDGAEEYYHRLSCEHLGRMARPKAAIEQDIVARKRVVCDQCQSDV
jgi:hypothetical protein